MASYNLKYNSDDSIIRHVIIGLLADLNNKVYFHRQLDNNTRAMVDVPFYYSISGDDQFLRDQFLFSTASGPDCFPDAGFADGNYDQIPRGVVSLTGMSIDTGNLVNKRNQGSYTKMNQEGAMEGYTAEFEMIPVTLSLDIEILVSSTLDAFKLTESIIKKLYKSNYFNVEVGHLNEGTYRLTSYYALPDSYDIQRPIDFGFEKKDEYKISLPIEINSFIPAFEWETEKHIGNRMFEIRSTSISNANINEPQQNINNAGEIQIITADGVKASTVNTNYLTDSNFNASAVRLPQQAPLTRNVIPLDAATTVQPVAINNGTLGQEAIIIATNGDIQIDTTNFAASPTITILSGGTLSIKYFEGFWYPTGSINTNIIY